jgi:hypothetical protein
MPLLLLLLLIPLIKIDAKDRRQRSTPKVDELEE